MKNTILISIILIVFLSIPIIGITTSCVFKEKYSIDVEYCVPTENEAKAIGEIICKAAFPDIDYSKYTIEVGYFEHLNYEDEIWIVCYSLGEGTVDGGGPAVYIKKKTGEVLALYLQA